MGETRVRFLVNKVSKRILYMEAGKDVVDLLLAFLQLPMATILSMLREKKGSAQVVKLGSISSIYESLQRMSDASLLVSKEKIINPPCPDLRLSKKCQQILVLPSAPRPAISTSQSPFGSMYAIEAASSGFGAATPHVSPAAGYVKEDHSFIITDDLCILPASTIESIVLLNKLNVEKMSDLDSLECPFTANEALELLKVSFTSTKALNDVFSHKIASSSFGTASSQN